MEQNKALDFYAKVFRLLLELDHVHYDNSTARPDYYFSHEDLLHKRDTVDRLISRMRFEALSIAPWHVGDFTITLMKSLADDIEYAVLYDSVYEVSEEDIEEELEFLRDDYHRPEDECEDTIVYEAEEYIREEHERAKEGALKVAAELRELADSVELQ